MATRDESNIIAGYRKVTWEELLAILRDIEGMPPGAVLAITQNVWICVPGHPQVRRLWARVSRALEPLQVWLQIAERMPIEDPRNLAVVKLLASASGTDGLGYGTLIMLAVDALRAEGLPLRSSQRMRKRGALEIVADVLYWVWRKPDVRAHELRRNPASIGAVYWKYKNRKVAPSSRLPNRASLLRLAASESRGGELKRGSIWIPSRSRGARKQTG
jgi:hypothetical protein